MAASLRSSPPVAAAFRRSHAVVVCASSSSSSSSAVSSAPKARFVARRSESTSVQQLARPLAEYMGLPASQYSVLDAERIERVDESTFRCYVYRFRFFALEVCPVLLVRVDEEPNGCCIRLLSCKLEGSPLVEAQNDKFSASMVNKVFCNNSSDGSTRKQLTSDATIEVTIDIPFPFRALPVEAIESSGRQVLEQLLRAMLPRFLKQVAVTQYALADHLVSAVPLATDPEDWLRMDSTVLRWLYGSISTDIVDMVMTEAPTAFTVLTRITALFRDNQQARTGYLEQKFRNIEQGDKSVTDYCLEQKSVADALADNGAPVTDNALVWNTIKGLSDDFKEVGNMAPYMTPFPDFLQFRNLLLLHELKPSTKRSSTPGVFYSAPAPGGYRAPAPPAPPAHGAPPGYGAPAPAAPHRGRGKKRKTGNPAPAPVPNMQNPWTGSLYMYPMVGPQGLLGSHPHAPAPRPSYAPPPRPAYTPPPRHAAQGYLTYPAPPPPATFSYPGQAPYGAPYGASSAPTWDPSALANYFNTMSLQAPTDWHMDTGASAHMSSDAGSQDRGRDSQVQ